jgi:hypothetical protein
MHSSNASCTPCPTSRAAKSFVMLSHACRADSSACPRLLQQHAPCIDLQQRHSAASTALLTRPHSIQLRRATKRLAEDHAGLRRSSKQKRLNSLCRHTHRQNDCVAHKDTCVISTSTSALPKSSGVHAASQHTASTASGGLAMQRVHTPRENSCCNVTSYVLYTLQPAMQ